MLNSRLGLFTAALSGLHPNRAPLLPKLRGHFAEFLNESSLAHLRILSSSTCRFAVRAVLLFLEAFLDSVKSGTSVLNFLPITAHASREADLPTSHTHCLDAHFHSCDSLSFCVTPSVKQLALVQESLPVVHRLRLSASA